MNRFTHILLLPYLVITTFIAYQPRANPPSFRHRTFSKSPTVGSSSWLSSKQSPKSSNQTTILTMRAKPVSDLLSLREIFTQGDTQFRGGDDLGCKAFISPAPVDRTSKERGLEGHSEEIVNPIATTATSVQLGASQGELRRSYVAQTTCGPSTPTYYPRQPDYTGRWLV